MTPPQAESRPRFVKGDSLSVTFSIELTNGAGGDLISRIGEWIDRHFLASATRPPSNLDLPGWQDSHQSNTYFPSTLLTLFSTQPSQTAITASPITTNAADLNLIREIRNGNRARYAELVDRYQLLISRRMWKFSRIPQEHEELVQEVFVEAFLSLRNFRGDAPFEHWLQKIATRIGYRFWSNRRQHRSSHDSSPELLDTLPSRDVSSNSTLEADESARILYQLLERLPTEDRLVMTLFHLESFSISQIAEQLGWSPGNVKVRAHRARKKLAEWLQEETRDENSL